MTTLVTSNTNRTTRLALATYPKKWRDQYGDEIVDTLCDVENAHGRVPLTELVALIARGTVMRAKTSIAFWGGLAILAMFGWLVTRELSLESTTGSWNDLFIESAAGLQLALPAVAALAAIQGHRYSKAQSLTIRIRLTRMMNQTWPLLITLAVAWSGSLFAGLIVAGVPLTADGNALIPLALLSMSVGTIAVGYAVGAVIHPILAVPSLLGCVFWWFLTPTWVGNHPLQWSNITGYNLFSYPPGLESTAVPQALLVVPIASLVAVLASVIVVACRVATARRLVAAAVTAALIASGIFLSPPLLKFVGGNLTATRSAAGLLCSGSAPRVCLWPEQQAQAGAAARAVLTSAYNRATAAGLVEPATISAVVSDPAPIARTGILATASPSTFNWAGPLDKTALTASYAVGLADASACVDKTTNRQLLAAEYATALTLGVPEGRALPSIGFRYRGFDHDVILTKTQTVRYLGVTSKPQAQVIAANWSTGLC
jgi:hypothetical protein